MVQKLIERLYKKGWKKEEILKAVGIINHAKEQKKDASKLMDRLAYWIFILVVILINLGVSLVLIPVVVAVKGFFFYFIVVVIGVCFGLMAEIVIRSMEHLQAVHHATLSIIMPASALLSFVAIGTFLNTTKVIFGIEIKQDIALTAILYALAFALPYLVYKHILKKEYYG